MVIEDVTVKAGVHFSSTNWFWCISMKNKTIFRLIDEFISFVCSHFMILAKKKFSLMKLIPDGVHHRGWYMRLPLLPFPVLHGVPGVQKHQREKIVPACDDQSSPSALRGASFTLHAETFSSDQRGAPSFKNTC